jgi:hypothetical protein
MILDTQFCQLWKCKSPLLCDIAFLHFDLAQFYRVRDTNLGLFIRTWSVFAQRCFLCCFIPVAYFHNVLGNFLYQPKLLKLIYSKRLKVLLQFIFLFGLRSELCLPFQWNIWCFGVITKVLATWESMIFSSEIGLLHGHSSQQWERKWGTYMSVNSEFVLNIGTCPRSTHRQGSWWRN